MPPTTDDTTGMPPGSSDDGGSSSSTSGGGGESESGSSSSDTGGGGLSFEADIWPVLTMVREPPLSGASDSCSGTNGCHAGGGAGGLALPDASTAYDNLIDAPSSSTLCAGMLEVVAGEPDNSCFVVFYEDRLRDSLGWVEQSETDLIRDWVEAGAAP
jgi:hypothetical protein